MREVEVLELDQRVQVLDVLDLVVRQVERGQLGEGVQPADVRDQIVVELELLERPA